MTNYGKLTLSEQLELKSLATRELSIQSLMQRILTEQEELDTKRNEWFNKIRDKYRIPDQEDIYVDDEYWILKDESK